MSETNTMGESSVLGNAGQAPQNIASFRNTMPGEYGLVRNPNLPALPPRPDFMSSQGLGMNTYGGMDSYGRNGMGSYGMGSYGMGSYGMGSYGMGGYGGYGIGGYGMGGMGMNSYGPYNRMGQNPYGYDNIESRFIQMAEENSRPAFESIQSLVYAVGGVSMMLENTFFALTSSFRAILGVAENFGRLRSVFAQFWTTFGVLRSINWLVRKLSVMLGIRTKAEFEAWAEAVAATQAGTATPEQRARGSSWPVLLFFGLIAAAPYILLKMFNRATTSETLHDPKTWKNALKAVAQYAYQAASPQELSFNPSQVLMVAPQGLQGSLWSSGWVMATADGVSSGLIPVPYVRFIRERKDGAEGQGQGQSPGLGRRQSHEFTQGQGQKIGYRQGQNQGFSQGQNQGFSQGQSHRFNQGQGQSHVLTQGQGQSNVLTQGQGQSNVLTQGQGQSNVLTQGQGQSHVLTQGQGQSNVLTQGQGQSHGLSQGQSHGVSQGQSHGITQSQGQSCGQVGEKIDKVVECEGQSQGQGQNEAQVSGDNVVPS